MTEHKQKPRREEIASVFEVNGEEVVGVLHRGDNFNDLGVLFLVGGRQYRTGAQRQFVRLGRHLATFGYSAFRFDVRGMGDSAIEPQFFLETEPDFTAAIAEFRRLAPQVERVLLWGLCDGASAAIVYASQHTDIESVMMINPWITTRGGAARATLKHYYLKRLISTGLWRELLAGSINPVRSVGSLGALLKQRFVSKGNHSDPETDLPNIVFSAVERFKGDLHVVISKNDLTAREFKDEYNRRYHKVALTSPISQFHDIDADHTFSSADQHRCLESLTLEWCRQQAERSVPS